MELRFLEEAIRLACDSVHTHYGGPFGAVVVRDGDVISTGANRVTVDRDPTAHAEVVAIRAACQSLAEYHLPGCTLYASCEPCPMCLSAAYWARVDAIYYAASRQDAAAAGFDDSLIYEQFHVPVEQRIIPQAQTSVPTALEPFRLWEAFEERTPY